MLVLIAQLNPIIGDLDGNTLKVVQTLKKAREKKVDIVLFSELILSGYFPEDLLLDRHFIESCDQKLKEISEETKTMFVVIGLPRINLSGKEKFLYNSAAILCDGTLLGFHDKILLPTYDVFDERRYFEPGKDLKLWEFQGKKIGVTICEDLWQRERGVQEYSDYFRNPVFELKKKKLDLLLNLSSSPYDIKKSDLRINVFKSTAKILKCPVVFCNQVGCNDQLVFDGHSLALNSSGELVAIAHGFKEDELLFDTNADFKPCEFEEKRVSDLYSALRLGVKDYFQKQGFRKAILGLSGGVDSALVACIAKDALGPENLKALMLSSRYTSKASIDDAKEVAKILGIELIEFSIEPIFKAYLKMLEPQFQNLPINETEENLQSRIRGMILMAFCNKFGFILLNTGNKSELAMGYCTLYGDMAGGLGVLHDVTKTKVYELAKYTRLIPKSILKKAPSAELKEDQTDFDVLPDYELLDSILEDCLEKHLSVEQIAKRQKQPPQFVRNIIHKIHLAEYKRRQAPIGIRVSTKAFHKGRVVPIVQKWK